MLYDLTFSHSLHESLVHLLTSRGDVAGVGFLMTSDLVCTCMQAAADALELAWESQHVAEGEIWLEFPLLERANGIASLHARVPGDPRVPGSEIVILRLETLLPAGSQPASLVPALPSVGQEVVLSGFPVVDDEGQRHVGSRRAWLDDGVLRLEETSQQEAFLGCSSGTPIWDERREGIVGMLVSLQEEAAQAFFLPTLRLALACSDLNPDLFLKELGVWMGETVAQAGASPQEHGSAIGEQCRTALILATVRTPRRKIGTSALGELVRNYVWQPSLGIATARQRIDEEAQIQLLEALRPYLPEELKCQVEEAVSTLGRAWRQAQEAQRPAPLLATNFQWGAVERAQALADTNVRAQVLRGLAEHPSSEELREALAAARTIKELDIRIWTLGDLAGRMSPEQRKAVLQEALQAVPTLEEEWDRVRLLRQLLMHLPISLHANALEIARAMKDVTARVRTLSMLAGQMPQEQRVGIMKEALGALPLIEDEGSRGRVFSALAEYLSLEQREEALEVVRAFRSEQRRAQALCALVPWLSLKQCEEALEIACAIEEEYARAQVVQVVAPHLTALPEERLWTLWCETLLRLAQRSRSDLLRDLWALLPVMEALGGKEALIALAQVLLEMGSWVA